jgi:small nuclear ribonucleoprotein (snRNP)-like protein
MVLQKHLPFTFLFIFLMLNWVNISPAVANCSTCIRNVVEIQNKKAEYERVKIILKKNQEFLGRLGAGDASKRLKIHSNILIANVKLETLENEGMLLQEENHKLNCKSCQQRQQEKSIDRMR